MKKRTHLWLGIFVAISLLLPSYLLSAGKITIILPDGKSAGIGDEPFDSFFLDMDGNLTVVLPTFPNIRNAQIEWATPNNLAGCTISEDGETITAEGGKVFSFSLSAKTPGTTTALPVTFVQSDDSQPLTYMPEGAAFTYNEAAGSGTFTWTPSQAGNFVAVFRAGQAPVASQKVVDIHVGAPVPVDPVAVYVAAFYQMGGFQLPANDTWVSALKLKTKSGADLARYFFLNSAGGCAFSNDVFVANMYRVLLQREPDQGGYDWCISLLNGVPPWSCADVLEFFLKSTEFATLANNLGITGYSAPNTNPATWTVTTSVSPVQAGASCSVQGAGTYDANSSVTVTATATAGSGYTFSHWSENGIQVSTLSSYQFTITYDRNLVANFTYSTNPTPPTGGLLWDWNQSVVSISMKNGEILTYNVDVPPPGGATYLVASVIGATNSTYGYFTWQFPNGGTSYKSAYVLANGGAAYIRIPPFTAVPTLPAGRHIFTIYSLGDSNFRIRVDIY